MRYQLKPDQQLVKKEIYHHLNNGVVRVILGANTGFGKTVLAGSIMLDAISRGVTPIFIVDRIKLSKQAIAHFEEIGLNVSIIQGDNTQFHYAQQ